MLEAGLVLLNLQSWRLISGKCPSFQRTWGQKMGRVLPGNDFSDHLLSGAILRKERGMRTEPRESSSLGCFSRPLRASKLAH